MKIGFVNYMYIIFVTPMGKGYGCFAVRDEGDYKYKVGASYYSPLDLERFDKRTARKLALERIDNVQYSIEQTFTKDMGPETVQIVTNAIDDGLFMPTWAEKAYDDGAYCISLYEDQFPVETLISDMGFTERYLKVLIERAKLDKQVNSFYKNVDVIKEQKCCGKCS